MNSKKRNVLFSRGTAYVEQSVSDHTKSNYFRIPFYNFGKYSVKQVSKVNPNQTLKARVITVITVLAPCGCVQEFPFTLFNGVVLSPSLWDINHTCRVSKRSRTFHWVRTCYPTALNGLRFWSPFSLAEGNNSGYSGEFDVGHSAQTANFRDLSARVHKQ